MKMTKLAFALSSKNKPVVLAIFRRLRILGTSFLVANYQSPWIIYMKVLV
jgi:hypothetical protein